MMSMDKDKDKLRCERCKAEWIKRTKGEPVQCPRCKSLKWKEPKQ